MLDFNKEIINGSFNKVNKRNKEADCIKVSVRTKNENIEINATGKGLLAAGIVAIAPATICLLGTTIAACVVTRQIFKAREAKKNYNK